MYEHTIGEMPNGKPITMNLYDRNKRFKDLEQYQDSLILNKKDPSPQRMAKYGYDCVMKTSNHHVITG